jgi:hypothetical protein
MTDPIVMAPPKDKPAPEAPKDSGPAGPETAKPPKKKPLVKRVKKAPKVSQAELGKLTAAELFKLRSLLKEVGSGVVDRLDGEIASLALFLDGENLPGEKPVLPRTGTLRAMLACFQTLKVKPKKGRVKDLARIEALLAALSAKMPPGA